MATLRGIVDVIGAAAAARLVERFGGQRIYVPRQPEGHALATAIGSTAARQLSGMHAGEVIYVPVGRRSMKAEIAKARGDAKGVARRVGCSERYVQMVRRGR